MSLIKKTAANPVVAPMVTERMIRVMPRGGADLSRKLLNMFCLGLMIECDAIFPGGSIAIPQDDLLIVIVTLFNS